MPQPARKWPKPDLLQSEAFSLNLLELSLQHKKPLHITSERSLVASITLRFKQRYDARETHSIQSLCLIVIDIDAKNTLFEPA